MRFADIMEVRDALKKHAIKEMRNIRVTKSDPGRLRARCTGKGCAWTFFVSYNKRFKTFQLKTYKVHSCSEHYKNKFVSPKFIANHYKRRIRSNPRWRIKDMRETIREDFGIDVSLVQCSRAKSIITQKTLASYTEEYALLRSYATELLRTNPGSSITIMVDRGNPTDEPLFQRMYVCFDALKKGFLAGCRKVIAMDGCFLKGLCKGELLTAIARDANDQIYHVAWCVVELESKGSWDWFLEQLGKDLGIGTGQGWSFSTGQQKGLVPSIAEMFPEAEHRLCARHIYQNWQKKFGDDKWQKMFWACAKSNTEVQFNRNLAIIRQANPAAAQSMVRVEPKYWCRAWFSTDVMCDSVDNNLSESFNALILEARHKPIFSMLEDLCIQCMDNIAVKRDKSSKWQSMWCPKPLLKLRTNALSTRYCHIICNGKEGYEVRHGDDHFCVQLNEKKCSGRAWDLTGIPCAHAITCIASEGEDPEMFLADCYSTKTYWKIYDHVMQPLDGLKEWSNHEFEAILPPLLRVMPGRPRKKRVRGADEKSGYKRKRKVYTAAELLARDKNNPAKLSKVGRVMSCGSCGKNGHNTRTCKEKNVNQVYYLYVSHLFVDGY
ncbi:hypothetical protein LINPERPRIM_LOCUS2164 [Linum perenne]